MLAEIQKELRDLIGRHRLDQFFERWAATIDLRSHHANVVTLRQSDWNGLQREKRLGIVASDAADLRLNRIVSALLSTVSDLEESDLRSIAEQNPPLRATPPPTGDGLHDLIRRKLELLERERLLATDGSVKFKLDEEIRELREKLGGG